MKKLFQRSIFLLLSLLALFASASALAQTQKVALLLNINGAIGPATSDFIVRNINSAVEKNAEVIVLQIDTPGGLDRAMRDINKTILSSKVPVVSFVAPPGARAASAGTYILYASHIAAMAPGTNLGAATPVSIGSPGILPTTPGKEPKGKAKGVKAPQPPKSAMKAKLTNDAIAYIKSLAQLRGRDDVFAEKAVREAKSIPATEALGKNVINVMANNIPDLLKKINGMQVTIEGKVVTLKTDNISILRVTPDWRARFLSVITDPSVAYILLLIGIYGLFFEFANPGFVIPGIVGGIALLLALYAFQLLPINYAGLALIILGIAFLAAEAFMPSFGALGIGGIIAFVAGSILLLDTDIQGFSINWLLIFMMALINAAFFIGVIGMVFRARSRQVVSGREELMGMMGVVDEGFDQEGWIKVHSERWHAVANKPVKQGEKVKVIKVDGLTLTVESVEGVDDVGNNNS